MVDRPQSGDHLESSSQKATSSSDDSSFEIVMADDEGARAPAPSRQTASSSGRRWIAIAAAVAVVVVGGTGLAFVFGGAGEKDSAQNEELFDNEPGFEPYAGDGAPVEQGEDFADEAAPAERPSSGDTAGEAASEHRIKEAFEDQYGAEEPRQPEIEDGRVAEREPDGQEIIEDSRGESMSQQEAQRRAEGHLDSLENAETESQRRLRRRDIKMNSRVVQSGGPGSAELRSSIEVDQHIRERLREQLSGLHIKPDADDGVEADEYRGAGERER